MCELGLREYCREKAHGTGARIALEPAVTGAVEAAVHSGGRGKVTVSATLKTNQNEARAPAKSQRENAARHRRWKSWEERRKCEPIYGQISSYPGRKIEWKCRGETPI